ncbi:MAG TPA: sodium/proton-translocating pyrophosphatase, partial [Terriglobales bacterium]|nr:sodium/proton-translocating pyrophosphatase [Terriglobales bacterium]
MASTAAAAPGSPGGEAQLILPDLHQGVFLGTSGRVILMWGLVICALGLLFGFITYTRLRDLPVHKSMREVSELIWETCKTYLFTQGKFLVALEGLIAVIIVIYFGYFDRMSVTKVATIFAFSVLGILGSYSVAWYGIRVNTFANSRTAFASLKGKPFPCYAIP